MSRLPCSASWSAAVVVTILVIDAIRIIVSAVIGSLSPAERTPADPSYTGPSALAAMATTPGTASLSTAACSTASTELDTGNSSRSRTQRNSAHVPPQPDRRQCVAGRAAGDLHSGPAGVNATPAGGRLSARLARAG